MKFIYIGDPHERSTAPLNRTDEYFDTYQRKVDEIKALAVTHGAKAILQPGDFLDAPKYDNAFLMDVVKRWSIVSTYDLLTQLNKGEITGLEVTKALEKSIPMVGAIGNHELFGDSIQSYPKTSLAFLERIGFMTLPTKEKPFIVTGEDGTTVAITSSHYHSKMDTDAHLDDYIVESKAADFHIHMAHGYLTNRDMGTLFKHTTLDKIAHDTQADLTIAGHDHIGFPLTEVDGKWFINPGSMTRTKSDIKEMNRHPKALIIEVTKDKGVHVTEVPLKSAQSGAAVLSRQAIKDKQAKTAQMEEIKSVVNQAQVKQGTSIASIIKNIGEAKSVNQLVVDEVINLVTQKMEDMKPNKDEQAEPYTIKSLTLENFQSHARTVMELSDGLNVIIGESSHGKSSIYRALNWLYDNAGGNPRSYIKKGETYAKVTIELTNGYRISRIVESKVSGKNGYDIYNPTTKEVVSTNTKGTDMVRDLLGFHKVPLDGGKELDINFMGQGESWFFIGKHVTSSDRAKIIGSIFGTHFTDAVLKDMEGTLKKTDTQLKEHKQQRDDVIEDIRQYDYLKDVEERLKKAEGHYATVMDLEAKKERIARLIEKRDIVNQEVAKWQETLDQVKHVDLTRLQFARIQQTIQTHNGMKRLALGLDRMKAEEATWQQIEKHVSGVSKWRKDLSLMSEKMKEREGLQEKLTRHQSLDFRHKQVVQGIKEVKSIIHQTDRLKDTKATLISIKEKQERLVLQHQKQVHITQLSNRIQAGRAFLLEKDDELNQALDLYEDELSHAGTCPTCFSSIDTGLVKQVVNSRRA